MFQIPGPLTDEMEQQKKAKEAEKKKALRKARKEKMKVLYTMIFLKHKFITGNETNKFFP